MKTNSAPPYHIWPAVIVLFWTAALIFNLAASREVSAAALIAQAARALYTPHVNTFPTRNALGIDPFMLCYEILCCSLYSFVLLKTVFKKSFPVKFADGCRTICVTLTILFLLLQTLGNYKNFQNQSFLNTLTPAQRKIKALNKVFLIPEYYKSMVRQNLSAEIITDMDESRDPGMYSLRYLAYDLYPLIDTRGIYPRTAEAVILFEKAEARKHVPPGYKILAVWDEKNLLAVRNGPAPMEKNGD